MATDAKKKKRIERTLYKAMQEARKLQSKGKLTQQQAEEVRDMKTIEARAAASGQSTRTARTIIRKAKSVR